jgi:hypothetical protein
MTYTSLKPIIATCVGSCPPTIGRLATRFDGGRESARMFAT